ncbi:MAG: hypothetical protein V2A73_06095 [Pseudomonadota bacterium]
MHTIPDDITALAEALDKKRQAEKLQAEAGREICRLLARLKRGKLPWRKVAFRLRQAGVPVEPRALVERLRQCASRCARDMASRLCAASDGGAIGAHASSGASSRLKGESQTMPERLIERRTIVEKFVDADAEEDFEEGDEEEGEEDGEEEQAKAAPAQRRKR